MITGENGILTQSQKAKEENRAGAVEEARNLWKINLISDSITTTKTAEELEQLLNRLVAQGLLTEKEKEIIKLDGKVTIASRTIVFIDDIEDSESNGEASDDNQGSEEVVGKYKLYINPNEGSWENVTTITTIEQDSGTTKSIVAPTREGYTFTGWDLTGSGTITNGTGNNTYTYNFSEGDGTLTAQWIKASGIVPTILYGNFEDGITTIRIATTNEENDYKDYEVRIINVYDEDGDLNTPITLSGENVYGDSSDVATTSTDAQRMVVVKYHNNVVIEDNATVTAVASEDGYGGPKGMYICVKGTLTNNGEITMTARGAKAEGENVYLFSDGSTWEYVPATGGSGGASQTVTSSSYTNAYDTSGSHPYSARNGKNGSNGESRATGGGGAGAAKLIWGSSYTVQGSKGSTGTSYSGGTGGGGTMGNTGPVSAISNSSYKHNYNGSGISNGGSGGVGRWGFSYR